MIRWIVAGLLLVVGILNVFPAILFFSPVSSTDLYGIELATADLAIVMRHRAIMLGLLGAAFIYAAFRRDVVVPVIVAGLVGKAAFLFLVYTTDGVGPELGRVAMFDVVAVIALIGALVLNWSDGAAKE
jgi:hypothetical protein